MSRTASQLLEEQLRLARRVLSPATTEPVIAAAEIMRLASLTLELHRKLTEGLPFPAAWLSPAARRDGRGLKRSDS